MHDHPSTILIDCDVQTENNIFMKWWDCVDGKNGYLYGIPYNARRVLQWNIEDQTCKEIGPDLDNKKNRYINGIMADNGSIYCLSYGSKNILKITPKEGGDAEVEVLEDQPLPEYGHRWEAGVLAKDGCIYYLPFLTRRILKLDPNNGERITLVGEEIRDARFGVAVLANDGCIYGISLRCILKFNPCSGNILIRYNVQVDDYHHGGVLGADGNVYARNRYGQIYKIDTSNMEFKIIGHNICWKTGAGWGLPVLGADKQIYFPPVSIIRFFNIIQACRIHRSSVILMNKIVTNGMVVLWRLMDTFTSFLTTSNTSFKWISVH